MDGRAGEPGSRLSESEERLLGLLRDGHTEAEIGPRLGLLLDDVRPLVLALLENLRLDSYGPLAWPDALPTRSRHAGTVRYLNFDPSLRIPAAVRRAFHRAFLAGA